MVAQTVNDFEELISKELGTGNLKIRNLCIQHYWGEVKRYWMTGRGLLNINWIGNSEIYLQEEYYFYLSDIGFFHLLVNFGAVGGTMLLFFIVSTVIRIKNLFDKLPEVSCYFMIGLIIFPQIDLFF